MATRGRSADRLCQDCLKAALLSGKSGGTSRVTEHASNYTRFLDGNLARQPPESFRGNSEATLPDKIAVFPAERRVIRVRLEATHQVTEFVQKDERSKFSVL